MSVNGDGCNISRRSVLRTAASLPLLQVSKAAWAGQVGGAPLATTLAGKVRGSIVDGVEVFRGIPYAGAVDGPNRFKAAPPVVPWNGIRDGTRPGPPSIQAPKQTFGIDEPEPAENCLTLNVWTPAADGKRRPVMFYSHGGGFSTGSAASTLQDGSHLARLYDVVVVATNHRLGLLGYLYLDELGGPEYAGSGNCGLSDIAAGLRWVAANIRNFGGDPTNVMIFGESGGGAKTSCLYAMPAAAPYFNKASIESGPGIRMNSVETARALTHAVLDELGLAPSAWRQLLDLPAERLLAVQLKIAGMPNSGALFGDKHGVGMGMSFAPVVDGHVLPADPFSPQAPAFSRDKPLIVGYNHDEYAFFAMYGGDKAAFTLDEQGLRDRLKAEMPDDYEQAIAVYRASRPGASPADLYIAIRSARFAATGSILIAERKAQQKGAAVYAYVFDYQLETLVPGTGHPVGAMHALEIPFKFDNVVNTGINGGPNLAGARPDRIRAGANMSAMWTHFARTGMPMAPGQPAWPPYTLERRATMIIDADCKVVDDPGAAERRFWEARYDRLAP